MTLPPPIRPKPKPMSQLFWDGAKAGELCLQCCSGCAAHRFYPSAGCHKCDHNYDWRTVPGRGHVYTWTVIRRALDPAFQARVPFTVAVVAVDAVVYHGGDHNYDWRTVPGRHVYTWTVIRRALDPAFQARVPFTVAVVAVDVEGRPLLPGTMRDCAPEAIEAEMAMEIAFEPYDEEISLPCWRPAAG